MNPTSHRYRIGRTRLLVILGTCLVALLVALACALVWNQPKLPAGPVPTPNAADTLAEAAAAIQGIEVFDRSEIAVEEWEDVAALRNFLASNRPAIEKWEQACTQECVPIVDYSSGLSNLNLNDGIGQFRAAAYLPRVAGRLAELEERPQDAAEYYGQLYVMASKYGREGLWMHVMTSMAMQRLALQRLELLTEDLDDASAGRLRSLLATSGHRKLDFERYADRDRVLANNEHGVLRATLIRRMLDPVAETRTRCEAVETQIMALQQSLLDKLEAKAESSSSP